MRNGKNETCTTEGGNEATINPFRRPDEEDADKERQWLTSRDPSNLVTGVLKLGKKDSGWERWV